MRSALILIALLVAGQATATPIFINEWRVRAGDDPSWASPTFDDGSWPLMRLWDVRHPGDAVWMRSTIELPKDVAKTHPLGIHVGMLATHEIWWDGERIGGSGVIGRTAAAEKPGMIEGYYHVPDRLAGPGPHLVALRTSAFHRHFTPYVGYWNVAVDNYGNLSFWLRRDAWLALTAMSAIVLTGVFALAMFWFNRRERAFLLLATLCLASASMLLAEAWRPLFGYTYDRHIVRLLVVLISASLVGIQLVGLMIVRFPHRFGRLVLVATIVVTCAVAPFMRGWDGKSLMALFIGFSVAAAWSIFALARRMPGSLPAFIGVGTATVTAFSEQVRFIDRSAYFALDFLFLLLLCSHALEVRRERQERSEALLRSARLELEMLRRHIQPHFLMNTLTALAEWIEQEPRTAVRMIEALSEELRILGEVSSRTLIRVEDELRLCRSHLQNMSLRRDVTYALETDGIDERRMVPPAVFHTLVENAITHGEGPASDVTMRLSARAEGEGVRYVFEAPAADADDDATAGTGTRYIEARLREAWGERWSFEQRRDGALWRAELVTP